MANDSDLSLKQFEKVINHKFNNINLLLRALTHRSWAHERSSSGHEFEVHHLHNESFEFVGDSVFGLVIAETLFDKFPKATEGELSVMKHRLVSENSLLQVAKKLKLDEFLRMGRGEEKTGGRHKKTILADAMEAVIAAIFFDGGYDAAKVFVKTIFVDDLTAVTPTSTTDYKTVLQERLQADKRAAPVYNVIRTEGLPHQRTFFVEAVWDNGKVEADGTTIKTAAMKAAKLALDSLDVENASNN
ncbi:MAG: ribonuclease III [Pyrinomonadaceae bacterium]|nr:ribonuclease III [Pyrinomonadaceae bacterium]